MWGLCVATLWIFPRCRLFKTNISLFGGAWIGVDSAAASQSNRHCRGWSAIGLLASKSWDDLIWAKMAASSAFAFANAVCTDASCASKCNCESGACLTYNLKASEPHLPNSWILQSSIWVCARWTAPVARPEWPVNRLAPVGVSNGSPKCVATHSKVATHPCLDGCSPLSVGKRKEPLVLANSSWDTIAWNGHKESIVVGLVQEQACVLVAPRATQSALECGSRQWASLCSVSMVTCETSALLASISRKSHQDTSKMALAGWQGPCVWTALGCCGTVGTLASGNGCACFEGPSLVCKPW